MAFLDANRVERHHSHPQVVINLGRVDFMYVAPVHTDGDEKIVPDNTAKKITSQLQVYGVFAKIGDETFLLFTDHSISECNMFLSELTGYSETRRKIVCPFCDEVTDPSALKTTESLQEWAESGMCYRCQERNFQYD